MEQLDSNTVMSNEKVVDRLKQYFSDRMDVDIIESVAYECGYNLDKAASCMMDILNCGNSFQAQLETTNNVQTDPNINKQEDATKVVPHEELNMNVSQSLNNSVQKKKIQPTDISPQENASVNRLEITGSLKQLHVNRLIEDAKRGIKLLIIVRGLPGSGKSYLANHIIENVFGTCNTKEFILSTDDYFIKNNVYTYNVNLLSEAHQWNQVRANKMLDSGVSPVIIDNTNTQMWEMKPYCVSAVRNTYAVEILEPLTSWAFDDKVLSRKNKHNVPRQKIRDMLDRYERNITVVQIFKSFNLSYRGKLPPQPRQYPPLNRNCGALTGIPLFSNKTSTNVARTSNSTNINGTNENNTNTWCPIENSTSSWSVLCNADSNMETYTVNDDDMNEDVIVYNDVATMTSDFDVSRNYGYKTISPKGYFIKGSKTVMYAKSGRYDKGSMTDEDILPDEGHIDYLASLFMDVPKEYLIDIYEKCNRNITWTIDILLEDKRTIIENFSRPEVREIINNNACVQEDDIEIPEVATTAHCSPEVAMELKRHLESSVVINPEHYSDRILKMKGQSRKDEQACTSKLSSSSNEDFDFDGEIIDLTDCEEDLVELNLGEHCISQLEGYFGDSKMQLPMGFQPVIDIPISLAKQLHALYMESIFKQMDAQKCVLETMIKEDEEFATKLFEQEQATTQREMPNLRNIMNEEAIISKQKEKNKDWLKQRPADIAYKLTKQKLHSVFPQLCGDILEEILHAHNNCYKDTFESLLLSGAQPANPPNGVDITNSPINNNLIEEMQADYQMNFPEDLPEDISYREEAAKCQQKRQLLLNKAQEYYRMHITDVATYYSELASQQTHLCDKYNNLAAEQIIQNNFLKVDNFETIDLHQLRVKEAITALDIHIDRNIMLLQNGKNCFNFLNVITGRGKNSPGGRPRIKPAVVEHLQKRSIKCEQVNPGLLRVKIFKNSLMSSKVRY